MHNGDGLVSKTVNGIVQRPDEITELLAYYQMSNKRTETKKLNKISKQVQKGLAMAFNKFDEYQFAKYDRAADVKLRDALFLVHPKAKDDAQQALFNKIAKQELAVPYTWETELSALGQQQFTNATEKQQAFKAKWEELIDSNKLGYMALLRNLRNILEADVSTGHIQKICERLADEHEVAKSKQLPFRFLAAYREIGRIKTGYEGYVMEALEEAIQKSVVNLKGFSLNTRVVIACDVSGSMQRPVSGKSKVLLYDIGLLLGMLLQSKCSNVMTGMFGDIWKKVSLRKKNILANVDDFYKREGEVGYATNGYLVIKNLIDKRYMADKVMIFTDAQLWDSMTGNRNPHYTLQYQWLQYKKIAPKAKLYLFDLAGYGTAPLSLRSDDVYLIAGWSDKVFDVMEALENGAEALQHIHETEL